MPHIDCRVSLPRPNSFRVASLCSSFGFSATKIEHRVCAELPELDGAWHIGAIVGPSGSGKSLLAKKYAGPAYYAMTDWDSRAVIDAVGGPSLERTIEVFTAVGFSSIPSWCKPYKVLSNGEQMRVNIARALLSETKLIVFDEFTSTVDRHCARILSLALGKHLRREADVRFVAVACHTDFLNDLDPDWAMHLPGARLEWRKKRVRREPFRFSITEADRSIWEDFSQHHYLSSSLHRSARCFACLDNASKRAIGFVAIMHCCGWRGRDRVSRIVILPEYQGIGIGTRFLNGVANEHIKTGRSLSLTTAHPGFVRSLRRNAQWKFIGRESLGTMTQGPRRNRRSVTSVGPGGCYLQRSSSRFQFIGADGNARMKQAGQ